MTITEMWWYIEARRPVRMYGDMTEHEVKAIYEETYGKIDDDDEEEEYT